MSGGILGRHLSHPDVQRSWSQWSEDETLYVAVPYSNPFRWRRRRELLNNTRRALARTPNVQLYVGELAYGDRPHEVTGLDHNAPLEPQMALHHHQDVQFRTIDEMWHKENIANAVVQHFPPGYKYGAVIDGDFIMTRHDWALEAIHLLQHYDFVQLFSSYTDLTSDHRPYRMNSSFAWNYLHQEEFLARMKREPAATDEYYGVGIVRTEPDRFPFGYPPGAPGGAWAWNREAFNTVGRLLEICVLGSGDWHMAFGLVRATNVAYELERCTQPYLQHVLRWQANAAKLTRGIGCVDQHVVHPFHGSRQKRGYGTRWQILRDMNFDPDVDLVRDWQGIWRWSGNKLELRDHVRRYFLSRSEDDPNLYGSERPMV